MIEFKHFCVLFDTFHSRSWYFFTEIFSFFSFSLYRMYRWLIQIPWREIRAIHVSGIHTCCAVCVTVSFYLYYVGSVLIYIWFSGDIMLMLLLLPLSFIPYISLIYNILLRCVLFVPFICGPRSFRVLFLFRFGFNVRDSITYFILFLYHTSTHTHSRILPRSLTLTRPRRCEWA